MNTLKSVVETVPTSLTLHGQDGTVEISDGVTRFIGKDRTIVLTHEGLKEIKTEN